jgi:Kinesin motor domain
MGTPDSPGLIPRITSNLFSSISHLTTADDTCTVHISYFEIYNEQVRDLLAAVPQQFTDSKVQQGGLRVRERKDGTVFIEGLNEFQCKGFEDVLAFMKMGNKVGIPLCILRLVWGSELTCRYELRRQR